MAHEGKLRTVNRYITAHNAEGKAIFSKDIPEESEMKALPDKLGFALSYLTKGFPVDLAHDADVKTYQPFIAQPPGLTTSGGSVLRHVDFPPNLTHAMHRTVSIDYGVVLEGEMVCILDSGEERLLRRGDVCVQRGTMHAWRNPSESEWGRMMFVLLPCLPLDVGGEDLGSAVGIRRSD